MEKRNLYRVNRVNGGVDITPNKPTTGEYTELYRLIAGDGKVLTDGENYFICIDTDNVEKYTEIEDINPSYLEE